VRQGSWALLLLLGAAMPLAAAPELRLNFDKTEVEWGRPLRGYVLYEGPAEGSIDLSRWTTRFHVERGYGERTRDEHGALVRRESVRLYPRGLGTQPLPALSHGGARSPALTVQVLPPRPEGATVTLTHGASAERLSAGGQLRVRVRLVTTDPRARVSVDPMDPRGLASSELLPARREDLPDGGETVHTMGWALHPARPGRHLLALPPVRYSLFGRDLGRLYLPLLPVEVDALPAYVPLTVPVGTLSLRSAIEDWAGTRAWGLTLETDGLLPVGVPELESALAALSGVAPERLGREQRREARDDGVYTVLRYQAPLPRWLVPWGPGPALSLRYFDPASRRVQRLHHPLLREWRLPGWFVGLLAVPALALSLWMARLMVRWLRRWRDRRALIVALRGAADGDALRRLLLQHLGCRALGDWAGCAGDARARAAAARLNNACFARREARDLVALPKLKKEIIELVRRTALTPARRRSRASVTTHFVGK
jgi:hypothetical protein